MTRLDVPTTSLMAAAHTWRPSLALAVALPVDLVAEHALAVIAAEIPGAATTTLALVGLDDFYDPAAAAVLAAAAWHYGTGQGRDTLGWDPAGMPWDGDVAAICATATLPWGAGVDVELVRRWGDERTVLADSNGALARRVKTAAAARARALDLLDELAAFAAVARAGAAA